MKFAKQPFADFFWSIGILVFVACSSAPNSDYPHPVNNTSSGLMLTGEWVPENSQKIDFENLPRVVSDHVIINDVRDLGGTRVNQHNYLIHYNDRYYAMWSDGPGVPRTTASLHRNRVPGHDRAGQRVSFAVSRDGLKWSVRGDLSGPPDDGFGWIARGFWIRDGKLLALASRFNAPGYQGKGLQLHAYEMQETDSIEWRHLGIVFDNTLNNFPPKKIPTGEWMMSRRDSMADVYFMVGGTKAFDDWESFPMIRYQDSSLAAEEPYWWVLPDNNLLGLFRDNRRSGFLFRYF